MVYSSVFQHFSFKHIFSSCLWIIWKCRTQDSAQNGKIDAYKAKATNAQKRASSVLMEKNGDNKWQIMMRKWISASYKEKWFWFNPEWTFHKSRNELFGKTSFNFPTSSVKILKWENRVLNYSPNFFLSTEFYEKIYCWIDYKLYFIQWYRYCWFNNKILSIQV